MSMINYIIPVSICFWRLYLKTLHFPVNTPLICITQLIRALSPLPWEISSVHSGENCTNANQNRRVINSYDTMQWGYLISEWAFLFDRELVLAVLYVCSFLLVVLLMPFLNFQAQVRNIFFLLIGLFSFF